MINKIKRGNEGEQIAALFLEKKGFRVLERNYRFKRLEIDLIVEHSDLMVFVEVKTRKSPLFGYPEEFVGEDKEKRIMEAADRYLLDTGWTGRVRYDIVAITLRESKQPELVHFEDAFY